MSPRYTPGPSRSHSLNPWDKDRSVARHAKRVFDFPIHQGQFRSTHALGWPPSTGQSRLIATASFCAYNQFSSSHQPRSLPTEIRYRAGHSFRVFSDTACSQTSSITIPRSPQEGEIDFCISYTSRQSKAFSQLPFISTRAHCG